MTPTACVNAEPFALRVIDDSMAPEFSAGTVVIVDPSLTPREGDHVVAEVDHAPTLGRFEHAPDGTPALVTRARRWPLDLEHGVLGVVVQRAGRRRAMHKRYR